MTEIIVDDKNLQTALSNKIEQLTRPGELMAALAVRMHSGVIEQFETEGDGKWKPLAKSTQRQRRSQRYGAAHPILTRSGSLKRRIYPQSTDTEAIVAVNDVRARLLHFGGTVQHAARPGSVFLKSYKSGPRKGKSRFAKSGAKGARRVDYKARAYSVTTPARPFMVITDEVMNDMVRMTEEFVEE